MDDGAAFSKAAFLAREAFKPERDWGGTKVNGTFEEPLMSAQKADGDGFADAGNAVETDGGAKVVTATLVEGGTVCWVSSAR